MGTTGWDLRECPAQLMAAWSHVSKKWGMMEHRNFYPYKGKKKIEKIAGINLESNQRLVELLKRSIFKKKTKSQYEKWGFDTNLLSSYRSSMRFFSSLDNQQTANMVTFRTLAASRRRRKGLGLL